MLCDKILHSVEGKCYFKKTNKLVDKEMWLPEAGGGRKRKWMKAVKDTSFQL